MIKNIINFLDYVIFGALMLYFFCGGFKYTIDYLNKLGGAI
tara:strand:- start:421 stop:543 length:123 start_codon:yes stop_codon:yes gene_type:complete